MIAPPINNRRLPPFRRLRVYAFDPSASTDLDTAVVNDAVLRLPWERDLSPGPTGEYIEVIDVDPASGILWPPVDLNDPFVLAEDGIPPSEGNPQFHQQMVYGVAMLTISNFERALGRKIFWSPSVRRNPERVRDTDFVRRLRIYPHALREANAYYSPRRKALLFGYFQASRSRPGRSMPGGTVFTCLSHDIIAHETAHAVLDGIHRRYIEPSNPDALAFHEAFADIVALFQRFTLPEALRHQIGKVQGDLGRRSLLSDLARQFGEATGHYGALRSAIDTGDPALQPDATRLSRTYEPHERGAILVAAVFDAFLAIYHSRVADLLRLVTGQGQTFPQQDLHPDLTNRLCAEANKAAGHILRMCIRALDYLPPVDVNFGEFVRALVTADADLVPDDYRNYRIAVIEAFRRRGIYPGGSRSLAADSLLWDPPRPSVMIDCMDDLVFKYREDRLELWKITEMNRKRLWTWLKYKEGATHRTMVESFGLHLYADAPQTIRRSRRDNLPAVELHAVRLARRVGPDGRDLPQLVIEITQSRQGFRDPEKQRRADLGETSEARADFLFRGGCTLVVDVNTGEVRYCIRKDISSARRLAAQRQFLFELIPESLAATYYGLDGCDEPLAFLHRHS
jgi:hypothetical protein